MNIPIYRAKKIDSDEWIEGYLTSELGDYFITKSDTLDELANIVPIIDQTTLAIHFPNMVDKNGKKIFASLSEDGVGGDIFEAYMPNNFDNKNKYVAKVTPFWGFNIFGSLKDIEVVGIHKGEQNASS